MSGASSDPRLAAIQAAHERHFIKRVKQRFGLRVSAARYQEFCRRVMNVEDGTRFLGRETPARTQWSVRFGGHVMRVVLDEESERLVTCMPYAEKAIFSSSRDHVMKRRRLAKRGKTPWN